MRREPRMQTVLHLAVTSAGAQGVSGAREPAQRLRRTEAQHADHRDERHHLRRHQQLAVPLDRVAEAARRADELGRDHRGPCGSRRRGATRREATAVPRAATTRRTIVRSRIAHGARGVDQPPVDAAHARDRAEQDREERRVGHDEDRQRIADAEHEERQRNPRDARDRPQHLDRRIDDASKRGCSPIAIPSGMAMREAIETLTSSRARLTVALVSSSPSSMRSRRAEATSSGEGSRILFGVSQDMTYHRRQNSPMVRR